MKCDVKCSMDFFGRVVDGDPAVTQDFSPTPPFISAVAIPLAQREVEEKLMRVGLAALEVSRDGHDFDGADIQEMSERLGVIARVTMAEPCHPEHCICAEVSDFPVECLRDTPVLAALRELIAVLARYPEEAA